MATDIMGSSKMVNPTAKEDQELQTVTDMTENGRMARSMEGVAVFLPMEIATKVHT